MMNPKNTFWQKLLNLVVALLLFFSILIMVNWVHFRYFPINVVFYAAFADSLISLLITVICLFVFKVFNKLSAIEKIQISIIFMFIGYSYSISIPTVIDRSLSIYLLEKIDQRGGGVRLEAMPEIFVKEYLPEHRLIDVRITEQLESGTIVVKDNCVRLTKKGESVVYFSHLYRKYMLPRKRLLMGEYTDDLVAPFRHSNVNVDYKCQ